ncbi:MAG: hypothetical protein RID07_14980, partial [Lacipirellulaceae bacterium]
ELDLTAFEEILRFANLDPEPAVLENFQSIINPKLATGRRSSATEQDLTVLRKWIEPTMLWLGYQWPCDSKEHSDQP